MLIVSQDRESAFNFENMKSLELVDNEVDIVDDILQDKARVLGTYKTPKRAKEVFQELILFYTIYQSNYQGHKATKLCTFYMPIE